MGLFFEVTQTYPTAEAKQHVKIGSEVVWVVPPRTALILTVAPSAG